MMTEGKKANDHFEARYFDTSSFSRADVIRLAEGSTSPQERLQASSPASQVTTEQVLTVQPMSFWDHALAVLFLSCGVPNGVLVVPCLTYLTGRFLLNNHVPLAFQALLVALTPLALVPQSFVPTSLQSQMAVRMLQYFSFRVIVEEQQPNFSKNPASDSATLQQAATPQVPPVTPTEPIAPNGARPRILVAPPHGVFPYGNLLAMVAWPCLTGHHFQGLAANSALRVPGFKQILRSIGVVDASRQSARRALEQYPYTIGISTGGVAEVFETNSNDECILLQERTGLIKLAIRTGADLVPCYVFGNTKVLACWAGEGLPGAKDLLGKISRKIGFATVLFFGRWGLPIPMRVPLLAVTGKAIPTYHLQGEDPTDEQVAAIQGALIADMQSLFDRYKGLYGWNDKTLIIK